MLRQWSVMVVAAVVAGWGAAAQPPDVLTAEQVLQRSRAAYAGCTSYRDTGVVREHFDVGDSHGVREITFRTAFVRPDRFRLEFRTPKPLFGQRVHIIWADGDEVRTWWDVAGGEVARESLCMAVAAAAGISSRLSTRVPPLLMPGRDLGGGIKLVDLERLGDEPLDGRLYVRVSGREPTLPITREVDGRTRTVEDGGTVLWIDPETWALRRVEAVLISGGRRVTFTTTYDAAFDEPLDESLLAFSPP